MNAAIRGALGRDVHADAPTNRGEMNDEIRRAAGRAPEQEEDR